MSQKIYYRPVQVQKDKPPRVNVLVMEYQQGKGNVFFVGEEVPSVAYNLVMKIPMQQISKEQLQYFVNWVMKNQDNWKKGNRGLTFRGFCRGVMISVQIENPFNRQKQFLKEKFPDATPFLVGSKRAKDEEE